MAASQFSDWFQAPTPLSLFWLTFVWLAAVTLSLWGMTDVFEYLPSLKSNWFGYLMILLSCRTMARAYRNYFRNKKLSAPAAD